MGEPKLRPYLQSITNVVSKYEKLNNSHKFIANKSIIPLMAPTFDSDEIMEAIESLLTKEVTMGKKVQKFETAFADYVGVKYAVMVNSGSSANLLALSCLHDIKSPESFKKGSEIITPAVTWSTTVFPIHDIGAKPVFVDINLETLTLDIDQAEAAVNKNTIAMMPVHLLGSPCNMDRLIDICNRNNLMLIEDSCEAHGAMWHSKKIGSYGDLSTFSFFFSHHISTIEGGMVLTSDPELYQMLKSKRAHGWIRERDDKQKLIDANPDIDPRFLFVTSGFNLRPTEIQGAFGIHQIRKLEKFLKIRLRNSRHLTKILKEYAHLVVIPKEEPNSRHAWFGYPLILRKDSGISRKKLIKFLESKRIESRPIMAGDITQQPVMKDIPHRISGTLENSNLVHANGLFLPNHQAIGNQELEYISDSLHEFFETYRRHGDLQ